MELRCYLPGVALTDEQRGPQAAWLNRHIKARFGRGEAALRGLADELEKRGVRREPETIKGWIASQYRSPIPPEIRPHLEELFNDKLPAAGVSGNGELVEALRDQTVAISALVDQIRDLVATQSRLQEQLDDARAAREFLNERVAAIEHGRAPRPVKAG